MARKFVCQGMSARGMRTVRIWPSHCSWDISFYQRQLARTLYVGSLRQGEDEVVGGIEAMEARSGGAANPRSVLDKSRPGWISPCRLRG